MPMHACMPAAAAAVASGAVSRSVRFSFLWIQAKFSQASSASEARAAAAPPPQGAGRAAGLWGNACGIRDGQHADANDEADRDGSAVKNGAAPCACPEGEPPGVRVHECEQP
eukprot:COSAG01_NODE_14595_length_1434_cov_2.269663_3_plen_112_part_00